MRITWPRWGLPGYWPIRSRVVTPNKTISSMRRWQEVRKDVATSLGLSFLEGSPSLEPCASPLIFLFLRHRFRSPLPLPHLGNAGRLPIIASRRCFLTSAIGLWAEAHWRTTDGREQSFTARTRRNIRPDSKQKGSTENYLYYR